MDRNWRAEKDFLALMIHGMMTQRKVVFVSRAWSCHKPCPPLAGGLGFNKVMTSDQHEISPSSRSRRGADSGVGIGPLPWAKAQIPVSSRSSTVEALFGPSEERKHGNLPRWRPSNAEEIHAVESDIAHLLGGRSVSQDCEMPSGPELRGLYPNWRFVQYSPSMLLMSDSSSTI